MEIIVTLAGANFRPKEAKDVIKTQLEVGGMVHLVRDRDNAYDERAIQIHYNDVFIGYVPKADNLLLSQKMDWCIDHGVPFGYFAECTGFMGVLVPTFRIIFDPKFGDETPSLSLRNPESPIVPDPSDDEISL